MRLACLVALVSAAPAVAGPMPFTYAIADSAGRLLESRFPVFAYPDRNAYAVENPIYFSPSFNPLQLPTTFIPGDRSGGYFVDLQIADGTLTITDTASGESGQVPLWFAIASEYEARSNGEIKPLYEGELFGPRENQSPAMLTLGDTRYDVSSRDGSVLTIELSAAPVSVQSPEPASLALAGLGLAAVAARRRWR